MRWRLVDGAGELVEGGSLRWEKNGALVAEAAGARWSAPREKWPNGEWDDHAALMRLGRELALDGRAVACCGSCARFQCSGMSRQMSSGRRGYCLRVGFRNKRGLVDIDHACGEHVPLDRFWDAESWGVDAVGLRQVEAREEGRLAAFEGALVGLAVGDALGFPCEFRSRAQILDSFGPDGVTGFVGVHDERWRGGPLVAGASHPPGTFSDDTQMSLAIAEALIDVPDGSPPDVLDAMARRFVEWSRSPSNDRAPGNACMTGCENLASGVSWADSGVQWSKGAGAPMRAVPIGLRYWRDHERLVEVARLSSLPTHGHPTAVQSAAAVALATALALEKKTPEEIHRALIDAFVEEAPELGERLRQIPALLDTDPSIALSSAGLGEGWVAEEAVATALYCLWRWPDDFASCVLAAANTDGDSDTIACIAGGLCGALNGIGAIPAVWRTGVENAIGLRHVAARLHETHCTVVG